MSNRPCSMSAHFAVVPPLTPVQVHDHGPEPPTTDAVPAAQSLLEGAAATAVPLALPQVPLTTVVLVAEQESVVPPFAPVQGQFHGPLPLTVEAVPALHRLTVGLSISAAPSELPQAPLTAATFCAEQFAVAPPLLPAQVHAHGPFAPPCTAEAVPTAQRLAVGGAAKMPLLDEPQTPLTAGL